MNPVNIQTFPPETGEGPIELIRPFFFTPLMGGIFCTPYQAVLWYGCQYAACDGFAPAAAVKAGCIKVIDAAVSRMADQCLCMVLPGAVPAEGKTHGAHAQAGDRQARFSQSPVNHGGRKVQKITDRCNIIDHADRMEASEPYTAGRAGALRRQ